MSKYDIHESSTRCTRIIIFNDYSHLKHDLLSEHRKAPGEATEPWQDGVC